MTSLRALEADPDAEVAEIWDNSKSCQGRIVKYRDREIPIFAPHMIPGEKKIIVLPDRYFNEIQDQLITMGYRKCDIFGYNVCFQWFAKRIVEKYSKTDDPILKQEVDHIQRWGLDIFNNGLMEKYKNKEKDIQIFTDDENGLFYALWNGKRLYLKRSMTRTSAQEYICSIMREQDPESPHSYRRPGFEITAEDTLIDGGAAEGFFSLENIDKVKKAILIEVDDEWVEALNYTFKDFKDKVVIVSKYLGDTCKANSITIDELANNENISFIKMDIEGAECSAIRGGERFLKGASSIRLIVCSYHKSDDADFISGMLSEWGYRVDFSEGFMFFPFEERIKPELRKALVLAYI